MSFQRNHTQKHFQKWWVECWSNTGCPLYFSSHLFSTSCHGFLNLMQYGTDNFALPGFELLQTFIDTYFLFNKAVPFI